MSPSQALSQSLRTALAGIESALPLLDGIALDPLASPNARKRADDARQTLRNVLLCSMLAPMREDAAQAINARAATLMSENPERDAFAAYLAALAEYASPPMGEERGEGRKAA